MTTPRTPARDRSPGHTIVRSLGLLVPSPSRDEWLAEWSAELEHSHRSALSRGEGRLRAGLRMRIRALAALRDALWLRKHRRPPRWGGSALRDATRIFRRQPAFALMVIGTLGVGIGSATTIFSVVDGLMLRPLPFHEPDRLVTVWGARGTNFTPYLTAAEVEAWRTQSAVFEGASILTSSGNLVLVGRGEPLAFRPAVVEPGLLGLLGIAPALGRDFRPEEGADGADRVVVLSDEVWRGAFGADPEVLGSTVLFNDEPYTVVGVAPPTLRVLPGGIPQLLVPLAETGATGGAPRQLLARLAPGLTMEMAQARLNEVATVLAREEPREGGWGVLLQPVDRTLQGAPRRALVALSVAVVLLLVVACVNAAGLLFVRGVARRREVAVRHALGASRGVLFREALAETLLLAAAAGLLGVWLAWWGVKALPALAPAVLLQFSYTPVEIETRVLLFALGLTALVAAMAGVFPALKSAGTTVAGGQRSATASTAESRLRGGVQVVQTALAVLLLAGAGLFARSFLALTAVDPGYDPRNLVSLTYELPGFRYPEESLRSAFNMELDQRLRAIPAVQEVGWSGGGMRGAGFSIGMPEAEDQPAPAGEGGAVLLPYASGDAGYFRLMGIPLLDGRGFLPEEAAEGAPVAVIDRDLAGRLWPGERAVGRRFRIRQGADWLTVVGVVGDVKLTGPDDPQGPYLHFTPTSMERLRSPTVLMRVQGDPGAVLAQVREVVHSLDPGLPLVRLETAQQTRSEFVAQPRFLLTVMGVFAATALLLAAVGVYGLVSFTVARRTREIGIRMAIGARREQVLGRVLGQGMALAGVGLVVGLAGTAALSRFVEALLFGVSPLDPVALAGVCLVLAASFLVALAVPARKAADVDAMTALRVE